MRRTLLCLTLLASTPAFAAELSRADQKLAQRHYERGVEMMRAESWGQAAEEFKSALEIDRQMVMAHYNLGQCRMIEKRFVEAAAAYKAGQEAFEGLSSLSERERARLDRERREEMDELRDSLARLNQMKFINPDQMRIRLEERLRLLESIQYKDASARPPVPAEFRLALGSAYFRQDKLAEAETEYRAAIEVKPKLGAAHNNLAVIYLKTGRPDEAAKALAEAEKSGFAVHPGLKAEIEHAQAAKPQ